jgi:hypothetical protein
MSICISPKANMFITIESMFLKCEKRFKLAVNPPWPSFIRAWDCQCKKDMTQSMIKMESPECQYVSIINPCNANAMKYIQVINNLPLAAERQRTTNPTLDLRYIWDASQITVHTRKPFYFFLLLSIVRIEQQTPPYIFWCLIHSFSMILHRALFFAP